MIFAFLTLKNTNEDYAIAQAVTAMVPAVAILVIGALNLYWALKIALPTKAYLINGIIGVVYGSVLILVTVICHACGNSAQIITIIMGSLSFVMLWWNVLTFTKGQEKNLFINNRVTRFTKREKTN